MWYEQELDRFYAFMGQLAPETHRYLFNTIGYKRALPHDEQGRPNSFYNFAPTRRSSTTMMSVKPNLTFASLACLAFVVQVLGHAHHDELTEEEQSAPIDTILWLHIFLQAAVWGVLFPTGMVLGLSRSRWHVPLQVCRSLLRVTVSQ